MSRAFRMTSAGFTLIELVVALAVGAIVIVFAAMLIAAPVDTYIDQSGRSALNDTAEIVSRQLEEDLRRALPNSVSIRNSGSRAIIEMLLVETAGFYRGNGELSGDATRELTFAGDTQFAVFGPPNFDPTGRRLVVGNLGRGFAGRSAYQPNAEPGVSIPSNRTIVVSMGPNAEAMVSVSPGFNLQDPNTAPADPLNPLRVTRNRIFLVEHPVTYICNSAANARTLRRYANYAITANIPSTETAAQLQSAAIQSVLADNISACQIRCASGNPDENACRDTLSVQIEFGRTTASGENERLRLHRQFDMDNDL